MRENYRISEVAKLFNISRRTLLYYDEINLFKPHYIDSDTAYRYYSESQIYNLRFILDLKKSGLSLSEIKEYTDSEKLEDIQSFLNEKIKQMEDKILELKKSVEIVKNRNNELENIKYSKGLEPSIVNNIELRVLMLEVEEPCKYPQINNALETAGDLVRGFNFTKREQVAFVNYDNLQKKDFYPLKMVGYTVPESLEHEKVISIKRDKCASIIYYESFGTLEKSYRKICEYIEKNGYKIIGDAIEILDEEKISAEKGLDRVAEILIPIE